MCSNKPPVFRFAPSPNGALHLGHAYCALLNQKLALAMSGTFLLRIEDIDTARCTPLLEQHMLEDLHWLGLKWPTLPRRQSQHFSNYQKALELLRDQGLLYPSFMSRSAIKKAVQEKESAGQPWPKDPDGAPHYPGNERDWSQQQLTQQMQHTPHFAWRLNMQKALAQLTAPLYWQEFLPDHTTRSIKADPAAWGDVILARSDTPTSYHLSVVIDDALQNVTHVVRGKDLFYATAVHRLLQVLLNRPAPYYHHHPLILDESGKKLSKSDQDTSLRSLKAQGRTPLDIVNILPLS